MIIGSILAIAVRHAAPAAVGTLDAGWGVARWSGGHGSCRRVVRHNDGERQHQVAGGALHREPRRAVQPVSILAAVDGWIRNSRRGAREGRGPGRCRGRHCGGRRRPAGSGGAAVALQLRVGQLRSRRCGRRGIDDRGPPACLICLRCRRVGNGGARGDPKGCRGADSVLISSHKGKREAVVLHLRNLRIDVRGSEEAALVVHSICVNQDEPADVGVVSFGGRHGREQLLAGARGGAQSPHEGVAQQCQPARVEHLLLVGVQQGKVERGQVNLLVVSVGDVVERRQGKEGFNLLFASDAPLRVEEIVHSLAGARPEDAHGTGAVHDRFNNLVRQRGRPGAPRAVNLGPLNAVQAGEGDLAHDLVGLVCLICRVREAHII